jgi:hypothetical protein
MLLSHTGLRKEEFALASVDKLHRTSFKHPVWEHRALEAAAKAEGVSNTVVIRRALQAELKKMARAQARRSA